MRSVFAAGGGVALCRNNIFVAFFSFLFFYFLSSSFKRSFMAWHDTAKSGRLISIDTFKCQKDSMKLPRFDVYSSCSVGTWTLTALLKIKNG